jgi:hypothetical protein
MISGDVLDFEVSFITQTDKAVLVEYEGEEMWIPDSQIDEDSDIYAGCDLTRGEEGTLICSEWIAKQKNMI